MSNRQNRASRSIRGPQSALTDFLQSQNISARQIRDDADARRRAAAAVAEAEAEAEGTTAEAAPEDEGQNADENGEDGENSDNGETARATLVANLNKKRKKESEAIAKIKKSKAFKKRKKGAEDDDDSDDLANAMFHEKLAPLPGQMENCEICEKRFTVTPYSRAGPNGGLLCTKCGKDIAKEDAAAPKKKKKTVRQGAGRRSIQSRILDGTYSVGSKSLMTLCIEKLGKNIHLADELGDLPTPLVDKIARQLSKRRLLDSQNLDLFLQPQNEDVKVYDGSRLSSDDYLRVFQRVTSLKNLKVRNAIQFKDEVMAYLITRNIKLDGLHLHGANLLSDDSWKAYFEAKGKHLKSLKVYYTDRHFGDETVGILSEKCPSLKRLKISNNQEVTDKGIEHLAGLTGLEHLSLDLRKPPTTEPFVKVLKGIGKSLRTLSLKQVMDVDDRVLDAIRENCCSLSKLRITDSEFMTDPGFARLFKQWKNRPLKFIDLQKCRQIDPADPRENPHMVGLCSDGFRALMEHSGETLQKLNVHACRNISQEAFEEVFSAEKVYPELTHLEISFCENVTDFVVGCIFRSCPNMKELNVFGCMRVKNATVPRGKLLIGVPNAMGMTIEGLED